VPIRLQHLLVGTDGLADHQRPRIFQRLADFFTAGHFTDAGAPGVVGQNQDVAGEKRAVGAAEVQQHAVAAGDGNHTQVGDQRGGMSGHGEFVCQCGGMRARRNRPEW